MSLANVKSFMVAVNQDPALQQRLVATSDPAESVRIAVQMGAERGLPFTAEEFQAGVRSPQVEGSGELSDDQLGAVAGGKLVLAFKPATTMRELYQDWADLGTLLAGGTATLRPK
jgi:predicted ribosomally synthesized peptide with nif11-like leader